MRQADLAGPRAQAAADQRRQRGRMVRVAERPLAQQPAAAQPAGDRMDHAELERLGRVERRQDAGQPRRQHRLAGAGRADHQQVVAAGRGDLERALGALLALDVLEVEAGGARRRQLRLGRRQQLGALEVVDDRQQVRRREDLDFAGPGRLAAAGAAGRSCRRRARRPRAPRAARRRPASASRRARARRARHSRPARPSAEPPSRRAARARSAGRNGCPP